jgi:hypothetical protein
MGSAASTTAPEALSSIARGDLCVAAKPIPHPRWVRIVSNAYTFADMFCGVLDAHSSGGSFDLQSCHPPDCSLHTTSMFRQFSCRTATVYLLLMKERGIFVGGLTQWGVAFGASFNLDGSETGRWDCEQWVC